MSSNFVELPKNDLNQISECISKQVDVYKNSKILIYGGTGFIGTWLTLAIGHLNETLGLGVNLTIVSRDVKSAKSRFGNALAKDINFIEHDFSKSRPIEHPKADFIFHGTTPTRTSTGSHDPVKMFDAAINATNHAINATSRKFDLVKITHLSSGVVYGVQPQSQKFRLEDDNPTLGIGAYANAKITIDQILARAYEQGRIRYQSPRLFAFAGPLLQLDAHFAAGNFVLDGLMGRPIQVQGNPLTLRSYMYPADLICAILMIAVQDDYRNYNVGSEEIISIKDLAWLISDITSKTEIEFTNLEAPISNYIPSITNLKSLMPNHKPAKIRNSLERWIDWIQTTNQLTKEE